MEPQETCSSIFRMVFGGSIAITSALVAIYFKDWLDRRNLKKSTALLLKCEIESILGLIQLNNYVTDLKAVIRRLESGEADVFTFKTTQSPTKFFDTHIKDLGLLGDTAKIVMQFYSLVNSALSDNDTIAEVWGKAESNSTAIDPKNFFAAMISLHKSFLMKAENIIATGALAVEELAPIARGNSRP